MLPTLGQPDLPVAESSVISILSSPLLLRFPINRSLTKFYPRCQPPSTSSTEPVTILNRSLKGVVFARKEAKLLKGQGRSPRVMITDNLRSYGAAKREIMPGVEHQTGGLRRSLRLRSTLNETIFDNLSIRPSAGR